MRIAELENEDAIDLLADMMLPIAEIVQDKEFTARWESGKPVLFAIQYALKEHKQAVIELVAAMHREDPAIYKFNIVSLTKDLMRLMSDKSFQEVFLVQGQTDGDVHSGSAMETTEDSEK